MGGVVVNINMIKEVGLTRLRYLLALFANKPYLSLTTFQNYYNLINQKAREAELSLIQFQYDGPLPTVQPSS